MPTCWPPCFRKPTGCDGQRLEAETAVPDYREYQRYQAEASHGGARHSDVRGMIKAHYRVIPEGKPKQREGRKNGDERVIVQRFPEMQVQQLVEGAGTAAAWTLQTGKRMEQAAGIERVLRGRKAVNECTAEHEGPRQQIRPLLQAHAHCALPFLVFLTWRPFPPAPAYSCAVASSAAATRVAEGRLPGPDSSPSVGRCAAGAASGHITRTK